MSSRPHATNASPPGSRWDNGDLLDLLDTSGTRDARQGPPYDPPPTEGRRVSSTQTKQLSVLEASLEARNESSVSTLEVGVGGGATGLLNQFVAQETETDSGVVRS